VVSTPKTFRTFPFDPMPQEVPAYVILKKFRSINVVI
jgi:hypothetical protein